MAEARRSFLFLQGPVGRFFDRLGHELSRHGHGVARVNFNGGDELTWSGPNAVRFDRPPSAWPDQLAEVVRCHAVTDVLLFGDCRPRHIIARRMLRPHGIRVHVFEEGYFRPDWITHERNGVNGLSPLPREPEWYHHEAARLDGRSWPTVRPVGPSLAGLTREAIRYYAAVAARQAHYPHARVHRPIDPADEARLWLRRAVELPTRRRTARARQATLLESGHPFFLLALQLDADMQIRRHSRFTGMAEVLNEVIGSFARCAPSDARLAIKNHPLDCARFDLDAVVGTLSRRAGVSRRVSFIDGGDLPALLDRATGMVVVNSTAGLSSLHRSVPTIVLGRAIYDIAGLTHDARHRSGDRLDAFWREPEPPLMDLYRAFRRVVIERTQVNGGFYTERGLDRAVPLAAERLAAA